MLRRIVLFTLLLPMAFNLYADDFVRGKAQFVTEKGIPASLVKNYLLHRAMKDVISQELRSMGLNVELYWSRQEEAFKTSFDKIDERLKQRYKIEEANARQLEDYQKRLLLAKMQEEIKFADFKKAIFSYSIVKFSRSVQDSRSRYIVVDAKVDRGQLRRLYYAKVQTKKKSNEAILYVKGDIHLENGLKYSDLHVFNEQSFIKSITSHWVDYLDKKRPGNISKIVSFSDSLEGDLRSYYEIPAEKIKDEIPGDLENSLLLQVDLYLKSVVIDHNLKTYHISYRGDYFLLDFNTRRVIEQGVLPVDKISYSNIDDKLLGSKVVNHLYRMPIGEFEVLPRVLANTTSPTQSTQLVFFDYPNLNKVLELQNELKDLGVKFSLHARISTLSKDSGSLFVAFNGELSDLKDLLLSLASKQNFQVIDLNNKVGIKFTKE